MNPYIMKIYL